MVQTLSSRQQPNSNDFLIDIDDSILTKFTAIAHSNGKTAEEQARSLLDDYARGKLIRVQEQKQ
ncbi:hypothetical protein [Bifidobacterium sp. ESL0732]|uniref:hypothetical protein n=1 Tax=Bifidobacterium sp. ESL0732 TaxID=2983222 RepID=UPI0023F78E6F|nr:hypothetical protein [Bifidobacterium sp. ESL0732]WEV63809.1 hypothetical protein OZX70_07715 [Bifidobacterium sp. ESL0732]